MSRPCLLLVVCALAIWSAQTKAQSPADELQTVVDKAAAQFAKAFQDRDSKALAALFTPEAEYVDSAGVIFHGREAIAAEYAATFEVGPPGKLNVEIISIRPIADGAVVEDGLSTFTPNEEGAVALQRYTATHVRQADGTWLLASVRELSSPEVSPHDRLKSLAWLEGRWRQENDGTAVNTEWKWSENGNFLISEFAAEEANGESFSGTHRIGWDAERRQFRSWVFNSNGGAADGWWSPGDDGEWSVRLNGVDANGSRMSVNVTYERDGSDALVISQNDRMINGDNLPGFSNRVVRQPPAPADQASAR